MPHLLKVAVIDTILSLHQRGWSQRRIARELGVDRETVARHLRLARAPKPANAPIGAAVDGDPSKPANAPIGPPGLPDMPAPGALPPLSGAGRASDCLPWRSTIEAKLQLGLSAQRIHQDLVTEHGFAGSYYSVRRFVHSLEATQDLPSAVSNAAPARRPRSISAAGPRSSLPTASAAAPTSFASS